MPHKDPDITFRQATMLDALDLFCWKNDPDVRRFSIVSQDEIRYDRHMTWMGWALSDPRCRIYIIEIDGKPCGDVRCEIYDRYIEVAIKVDRWFRGQGIAHMALESIGGLVQNEFQRKLIAKIVYGNVPSMRLFESCGYRVMSCGEGFYICSKDYTPTSK